MKYLIPYLKPVTLWPDPLLVTMNLTQWQSVT